MHWHFLLNAGDNPRSNPEQDKAIFTALNELDQYGKVKRYKSEVILGWLNLHGPTCSIQVTVEYNSIRVYD